MSTPAERERAQAMMRLVERTPEPYESPVPGTLGSVYVTLAVSARPELKRWFRWWWRNKGWEVVL